LVVFISVVRIWYFQHFIDMAMELIRKSEQGPRSFSISAVRWREARAELGINRARPDEYIGRQPMSFVAGPG
jgi:hypothetical protein